MQQRELSHCFFPHLHVEFRSDESNAPLLPQISKEQYPSVAGQREFVNVLPAQRAMHLRACRLIWPRQHTLHVLSSCQVSSTDTLHAVLPRQILSKHMQARAKAVTSYRRGCVRVYHVCEARRCVLQVDGVVLLTDAYHCPRTAGYRCHPIRRVGIARCSFSVVRSPRRG